jgi:hypothetical protein
MTDTIQCAGCGGVLDYTDLPVTYWGDDGDGRLTMCSHCGVDLLVTEHVERTYEIEVARPTLRKRKAP